MSGGGGWEVKVDAGSLRVGQVVRNETIKRIGIVRGIENGIATIGQTNEDELARIDPSFRTRWA